ncbi:hypothetical protein [Desulfovibrio inopinatus]|uniref:hypothetical protein n=1 Tax=Desulfovibrio inopinatus TaxID=102109 RepID=UPI0012EC1565|nr:hypothetical protein [Desulfovibrio inopinatus]
MRWQPSWRKGNPDALLEMLNTALKMENTMALFDATSKQELATKHDVRELELRIAAELAKMKNDLTVRMGALLAATVTIIAALKLFS